MLNLVNQRQRCNDSSMSYNLQLNAKPLSVLVPDSATKNTGLLSSSKIKPQFTGGLVAIQNPLRQSMAQPTHNGGNSSFLVMNPTGIGQNPRGGDPNNHYENNAYINQTTGAANGHFTSSQQSLVTPIQKSYNYNKNFLSGKSNNVEINDNLSN